MDGILLQVGMGGFIGLVGSSSLIPLTTCPSGTYTCLHVASVAASWLFDPRVGYDKTYITPMGMQHISVHGRTTQCNGTDWEYCTWWSPSLRQGLLLDHSGMEGASSRIIFEPSGLRKQDSQPLFGFWYWQCGYYYHNGSLALRSFICVDVGKPTSHPCSTTGMKQDHLTDTPRLWVT